MQGTRQHQNEAWKIKKKNVQKTVQTHTHTHTSTSMKPKVRKLPLVPISAIKTWAVFHLWWSDSLCCSDTVYQCTVMASNHPKIFYTHFSFIIDYIRLASLDSHYVPKNPNIWQCVSEFCVFFCILSSMHIYLYIYFSVLSSWSDVHVLFASCWQRTASFATIYHHVIYLSLLLAFQFICFAYTRS